MTDIPINSDQFNNNTTPGYPFAANHDVVTIAVGILVGASQSYGVFDDVGFFGNGLINNGIIYSGNSHAVFFQGSSGIITNNTSGQIIGEVDGIIVNADLETVSNHGLAFGASGAGISMAPSSNHVSVTNDGEVYGRLRGVFAVSSLEGGTINNTGAGLIRSDHDGIEVYTATGFKTFISNAAGATVRGADYSIHTHSAGAIQLINNGKLFGNIQCEAPNENDLVINHGAVTGNVVLGTGNDTYNGQGGGGVIGNIQGGAGTDSFFAGKAREVSFGGANQDKFIFNATVFSPAGASRDIIQDFHHREADKIDVHGIDADLTHAGNQAFHFIGADTFAHYHSTHAGVVGMLRFDAAHHHLDGNVNANFANAEFEVTLTGVTAMDASDFVL